MPIYSVLSTQNIQVNPSVLPFQPSYKSILPRLVMETLQPLPEDRKCFRMINGVLVERTVKDVLPALKTNSDGLKQVLDELMKQYKTKQDEMDNWKVCSIIIAHLLYPKGFR
jgi:Prefoldin subunit